MNDDLENELINSKSGPNTQHAVWSQKKLRKKTFEDDKKSEKIGTRN